MIMMMFTTITIIIKGHPRFLSRLIIKMIMVRKKKKVRMKMRVMKKTMVLTTVRVKMVLLMCVTDFGEIETCRGERRCLRAKLLLPGSVSSLLVPI